MLRQLPANDLLLYCFQPLNDYGSESKNGLFRYAADTVKSLLKEEIKVYDKLKLSVYDGILSGSRTVSELVRKKYPHATEQLCTRLMPCLMLDLLLSGKPLFIYKIDPDSYAMSSPQQITAELSGSFQKTQGTEKLASALKRSSSRRSPFPFGLKRRTEELRLKVSVSLMRSAFDDLRFISRFNDETFFRGISDKSFSSTLIDLSDKSVKSGFAALYAMTFFGLSAADIFSVDSVFGFTDTGVRSKDDIRPKAAAELSARIMKNDTADLSEMADKMGEKLLELSLPAIDVNDPISLAQSCTLYAGFAQLGKSYTAACSPLEITIVPDEPGPSYKAAKQRAKLMAQYEYALTLCGEIQTLLTAKKPQLSSLKGYKQAQKLGNEVQT